MTKKDFVLLALEEIETDSSTNINYIKFWEDQYDLYMKCGIFNGIHNFTIVHLSI